jgi:hypothetical protein
VNQDLSIDLLRSQKERLAPPREKSHLAQLGQIENASGPAVSKWAKSRFSRCNTHVLSKLKLGIKKVLKQEHLKNWVQTRE